MLLGAVASLRARGTALTATIVGAGTSADELQARRNDPAWRTRSASWRRCQRVEAFALGRIMVVPSRAESFPYIVLEAAAAGKPLIATKVGGIPDMFGPLSERLVAPEIAPRSHTP